MPGFGNTMREFKKGTLHSGSKHGPVVTKLSQAKAIAVREEGLPRKMDRKKKRASKPYSPIKSAMGVY